MAFLSLRRRAVGRDASPFDIDRQAYQARPPGRVAAWLAMRVARPLSLQPRDRGAQFRNAGAVAGGCCEHVWERCRPQPHRRLDRGGSLDKLGGLHLIDLGEHDLMAHRGLAEHVEGGLVGVLEPMARVDQDVDAGEVGAAAEVRVDQVGPGPRPSAWGPRRSRSPACRPASASDRPVKNTSSWVRPGVFEVRASALRPVSALIRLDLPTLERPANAISMPRVLGSDSIEPAAVAKPPLAARTAGGRPRSRHVKIRMQRSRRIG